MISAGRQRTGIRPVDLTQRYRLFATTADEPRARRASDVITLVTCSALLAAVSVAAVPTPALADALARVLASFPDFLDGLWQIISDLFALLAVALLVAAVVRRRGSVARDMVVAVVVAIVGWLVVGRIVAGSWPAVWDGLRAVEPPPWYPSPRLALPGAVVITASPHVTLPMRRLGRRLFGLTVFAVAVLGATTPFGAVAGVLVAVIAAALVHVLFGSSAGRPALAQVRAALTELGVAARDLHIADRQQAGVFLVRATDSEGSPLAIKVYGRDAHDTALLSTLWRTLWYREPGSPLRLGRLQQVEHEAFMTLFAQQAGVPTDSVVTAGATIDDDALLVLRRTGRLLDDAARESGSQVDADATVRAIWSLVDRLGDRDIAHGQLDDRHLVLEGTALGLIDFRGAAVSASETQRRTDEAQAFVTTLTLVGEERAVAAARRALGDERLAAMLPYLQTPTLTLRQRQQIRELDVDLDDVRAATAEVLGTDEPPLQQLRRVSAGAIVRVVLPAIAVVALFTALAGLDFEELLAQLRDAVWWLVIAGIVIAQLARVTQAIATLGASPVALPLGPVYALQLAVSYINLAIPSAAARIAINIRFFQRHGVPPGSAIAAGGLDGFSGFVVQAMILVTLLVLTPASLDLRLGDAASSAGHLLVVVLVIAGIAVAVVAFVGRLRRFVLHWARHLGAEAWQAVRGLRSPRRIGMLFGGNLATELLFATALATFTSALGYSVGLDEALLVNISVALLSGLLPIPGGVGVAEGGLTFGLVQCGVPEEAAFAAVLLYRLWTFYLPPIWGYFAMRWLERNKHL